MSFWRPGILHLERGCNTLVYTFEMFKRNILLTSLNFSMAHGTRNSFIKHYFGVGKPPKYMYRLREVVTRNV